MEEYNVDHIIVGQGIAGTLLSIELIQRGRRVIIFNIESDNTSSMKAGGLYNPITGRHFSKTWLADPLFENLEKAYRQLETLLNAQFLHSKPIYRPFYDMEGLNTWQAREGDPQFDRYIQKVYGTSMGIDTIHDPYGGVLLNYCGYVDLPKLILSGRRYFKNLGIYRNERFVSEELIVNENEIVYRGIKAKSVIFCEGALSNNTYWKNLPFKYVRGETIDVELSIKSSFIFNQGVFIIPKDDYYTVGATYDHNHLTWEPQQKGIAELIGRLQRLYKGDYKIIGKKAGIRPATKDRKPMIGFHPLNKRLAIFNGFGSKGVSLVPYFSTDFSNVLEGKSVLDKQVNVERFF